jgi:hypothetical protein
MQLVDEHVEDIDGGVARRGIEPNHLMQVTQTPLFAVAHKVK